MRETQFSVDLDMYARTIRLTAVKFSNPRKEGLVRNGSGVPTVPSGGIRRSQSLGFPPLVMLTPFYAVRPKFCVVGW